MPADHTPLTPPPERHPQLTIEPLGRRVPVAPGQSLLEAAQAGGVRLARSCRNGTCRACLCRLTAGEVRYRVDWPGLSADEKAEGWTLPCVALPASAASGEAADVTIHALQAVVITPSLQKP